MVKQQVFKTADYQSVNISNYVSEDFKAKYLKCQLQEFISNHTFTVATFRLPTFCLLSSGTWMTTIPSLRLLVEIPSEETQTLEERQPGSYATWPSPSHMGAVLTGSDSSTELFTEGSHIPEEGLWIFLRMKKVHFSTQTYSKKGAFFHYVPSF